MANKIVKTTLHPDLSPQDTDLYPKTSVDMVEGLTEEVAQLVTETSPAIVDEYINNNIDKLKGEDGVGIQSITNGASYVAGEDTITPVTVVTTDDNTHPLSIKARNGSNGTDGNGIVTAHTLSHRTEGNEEITTVELVTDDGTNPQIEIHAKNGSSSEIVVHNIVIRNAINTWFSFTIFNNDFNVYSTLEAVISAINNYYGDESNPESLRYISGCGCGNAQGADGSVLFFRAQPVNENTMKLSGCTFNTGATAILQIESSNVTVYDTVCLVL